MTAAAIQHALGRPWRSMSCHCTTASGWIDAALQSIAAEVDGVLEVTALDSSPDGKTLVAARCYSDRLRLSLHVSA